MAPSGFNPTSSGRFAMINSQGAVAENIVMVPITHSAVRQFVEPKKEM